MKNIEWNEVTWYSKGLAVILFVATFAVAFALGEQWGVEKYLNPAPAAEQDQGAVTTTPAKPAATGTPAPTTHTTTTQNGTLTIGDSQTIHGTSILLRELTEDSRCPVDVQCIQAGTVRVRASVNSGADVTLTLGQPHTVGGAVITLTAVTPEKNSQLSIIPTQYRFTLSVTK
jgi:hypothetical protein